MRKTSTIIGLAMAIILTAYMSVLTLSNQAFAQPGQIQTETGQAGGIIIQNNINNLAGQETHLGQVLGGITTIIHHILKGGITTGLGCDPWDPRGC